MRTAVIANQIMRQLMTHHHEPIHNRLLPPPLNNALPMQVLEIAVVEEKSLALIESNRATPLVLEDMYAPSVQAHAVGAIAQHGSEGVHGSQVLVYKALFVGSFVRQVEFDIQVQLSDVADVLGGFGVTEGLRFLNVIVFRLSNNFVIIVRLRCFDRAE